MVLKREDFLEEKFGAKIQKISNFIEFSLTIKAVHVKAENSEIIAIQRQPTLT